MADLEFSQQDVASLADKLESLELTAAERALLSAVVSFGADAVAASKTPHETASSVSGDDVDIREELAAAFAPATKSPRSHHPLRRVSIGPMP
jgi:hypothetical protein